MSAPYQIDRGLLPWATAGQRGALLAVERHGSIAAAARSMQVCERTIYRHLKALKERAARGGYAPGALSKGTNAPGFNTCKTTVHFNADGEVIEEWRREMPELADLEGFVAGLCDHVEGRGPRIRKPPKRAARDCMLEVDGGEIHIGKFAWAKETGANYDVDIASRNWIACAGNCIAAAGPVDEILIATKGDMLHADNRLGITERGGNILDMDGRYDRCIDAARDAFLNVIEIAAAAARRVTVRILPGNHDWHSSKWLARVLAAWYRNTPHITVAVEAGPRQYHSFGVNLIGFAHGDKVRGPNFPLLMATEQPELWARCPHRHWHLGHIHRSKGLISESLDQHLGITVEYLPSLSAPDAWHHDNGFLGQRRLDAFLWHKHRGLIQRYYENPAAA